MNRSETALVLAKAAAYDQRTTGEADVVAWADMLADVRYADALEAVTRYYRDHDDPIRPAHLRQMVKAIRRERLDSTPAPLPAADPDDVAAYLGEQRALIARLADGEPLPALPQLPSRPVQALTAGAFRAVPAK